MLTFNLAIKLAPHIILSPQSITWRRGFIPPILTICSGEVLRAIVERESVLADIMVLAAKQHLGPNAIEPDLQAACGLDLDLIIGVRGIPGAESGPFEVITHRVARFVQDVDSPFLGVVGSFDGRGACCVGPC